MYILASRSYATLPPINFLETIMRMMALVFPVVALTVPCEAAPRKTKDNGASLEQRCRAMAGKEWAWGALGPNQSKLRPEQLVT
jgi:hypothetical protein